MLLDILSHSLTLPLSSYLSQDYAKTFGGMDMAFLDLTQKTGTWLLVVINQQRYFHTIEASLREDASMLGEDRK